MNKICPIVLPFTIWGIMVFLSWDSFETVLGFYAEYISAVCIELCSPYAHSIADNMYIDSDSCKDV